MDTEISSGEHERTSRTVVVHAPRRSVWMPHKPEATGSLKHHLHQGAISGAQRNPLPIEKLMPGGSRCRCASAFVKGQADVQVTHRFEFWGSA